MNNSNSRLYPDPWIAIDSLSFQLGRGSINDAKVRSSYQQAVRLGSERYRNLVASGRISHQLGAIEANKLRNLQMQLSRGRSSPLGLAVARSIKETGKTLPQLQDYYSKKQFGCDFKYLDKAKKTSVWREVIKASGRSNELVNTVTQFAGHAGRLLAVFSISSMFYQLIEEEDKTETLKLGAGAFVGGYAAIMHGASTVTGLSTACGPYMPACALGGFIVVGAIGAFTGELVVNAIY